MSENNDNRAYQQMTNAKLAMSSLLAGEEPESVRQEAISELDATPNEKLRELVEQWRSEAEYMEENSEEYTNPELTEMSAEAIKDCADELEGVLDE